MLIIRMIPFLCLKREKVTEACNNISRIKLSCNIDSDRYVVTAQILISEYFLKSLVSRDQSLELV